MCLRSSLFIHSVPDFLDPFIYFCQKIFTYFSKNHLTGESTECYTKNPPRGGGASAGQKARGTGRPGEGAPAKSLKNPEKSLDNGTLL